MSGDGRRAAERGAGVVVGGSAAGAVTGVVGVVSVEAGDAEDGGSERWVYLPPATVSPKHFKRECTSISKLLCLVKIKN